MGWDLGLCGTRSMGTIIETASANPALLSIACWYPGAAL